MDNPTLNFPYGSSIEKLKEILTEKGILFLHIDYPKRVNGSVPDLKGNLEFLSEFKFLEGLSIDNYNINLKGIEYLSKLQYLSILMHDKKGKVDFSGFNNLTDLSIYWNKKFTGIDTLDSLRKLSLDGYFSTDLRLLKGLKNLEKLIYFQSRKLLSLEGVENFQKLKRLKLGYLSNLSDVGALSSASSVIKDLEIISCKKMVNIDAIGSLKSLETLSLDNCGKLESIKFVQALPNLKELYVVEDTNILDGDMSPCIGIPKVVFYNRRHYSHKLEEIKKVNGQA